MRVAVEAGSAESVEADVLAAPFVADNGLSGAANDLDQRLGGLIARLAEQGELTGAPKSAPLIHMNGELQAARLALAGVGEAQAVDADALRTAAATVVREANFAGTVAWLLDDSLDLPPAEQARAIVDGTLLGAYDPGRWKHDASPPRVERLVIVSDDPEVRAAAERAAIVAEWTNRARDLANEPPNLLTPETLAARAAEVA